MSTPYRHIRLLTICFALFGASSCATWPQLGDPIDQIDLTTGYRLSLEPTERRSDNIFFIAAFSGGGARAAALSYGVLQQLSRDLITHDGVRKSMLTELDVISAVSGGSVTATAYALQGDRFFTNFKDGFLKQRPERDLWLGAISPNNLIRLASSRFARGDLLAEMLDRRLFNRATYADLSALRDRPFVVVGAADLSGGGRMEFTQNRFDALCLNLSSYSIARAVVASGAAPPALTPISLRNAAGTCGFIPSPQLTKDSLGHSSRSRRAALSQEMLRYQNRQLIAYLHLVDGAMLDNLAVRTAIDAIEGLDDLHDPAGSLGVGHPSKIIFVSVNAASAPGLRVARSARAPGELTAARLAALVAVDRVAAENQFALRETLDRLTTRLSVRAATDLYFIEVSPDGLDDASRRAELLSVPTSFNLPAAVIDRVACQGSAILAASPEYVRLLRDLSGDAPRSGECVASQRFR